MGKTILQIVKPMDFLFLVSKDLKFEGQYYLCYGSTLPRTKWVSLPQKDLDIQYIVNRIALDWYPP